MNIQTELRVKALSAAEQKRYETMVESAKQKALPGAEEIKQACIKKRAEVFSEEKNISIDKAKETIKARYDSKLKPEDHICFKDFGPVSCEDILADTEKYDEAACCDPLEPEEGSSRAKFFYNKGKTPLVHSMLHGGQTFYLCTAKADFRGYDEDAQHNGDIVPLPLERELEKPEPYPLDALSPILGGAAKMLKAVVQAPDGICAHAVLGFAAHTVQGHANVNVDGRFIPLNENFLSIASRSARKTECDNKAGYIHKNFQRDLLTQHEDHNAAFRDEMEAYKEDKKKILNNKKKTLSEKNEALAELRLHKPKAPHEPLLKFSDPTVEGIHSIFMNGTPSKYLCADEGGQVSGGHSMSAEKKTYAATTYSKWWDGSPVDRVRGGDGSSVLYGRRLSMHLMMQEKIAAEFFNDEVMRNQGLLSRFLVSFPLSLTGHRCYQQIDVSDTLEMQLFYEQIRNNLSQSLTLKMDEKTGQALNEIDFRTIYLEDDAKASWIDAYEAIEKNSGQSKMFQTIEGFAGKASNHIIRLAGIMALFEDIKRTSIPKHHVDNAIELMEYYLNERLRISQIAEPDSALENAKLLLNWIQSKHIKTLTLPDVYQYGPSRFRNKKQAQKSINLLQDHNWLYEIECGKSKITGQKSNNAWGVRDGKI